MVWAGLQNFVKLSFMSFKTCKWIQNIQGTCKVRNEFEKKRNWTKQNETNWNKTKNGNETKLNKIRNQLWLHKSKKKTIYCNKILNHLTLTVCFKWFHFVSKGFVMFRSLLFVILMRTLQVLKYTIFNLIFTQRLQKINVKEIEFKQIWKILLLHIIMVISA